MAFDRCCCRCPTPDSDAVSDRLAAVEDYPVYTTPPSSNGQIPSFTMEGSACVLSWDLTGARSTLLHVQPVLFESARGGVTSTAMLDIIISTNNNAPPTCAVDGTSPATSTVATTCRSVRRSTSQ